MKPKAAQVRQQQTMNRRARLEESAARVQQDLIARQALMRNMGGTRQGNALYGNGGYSVRIRDPNRGVITQAEWNELVERHEDSGRCFRYFFGVLIIVAILLLTLFKYDEEYNLEVPQVESGKGFGEHLNPERAVDSEELEGYYNVLGVAGRLDLSHKTGSRDINTSEEAGKSSNAAKDPDKERRRENYQVRQQIKKAFHDHQEKQNQLVHCGRTCEAQNKQIELAYSKLTSQVDRELFGVLLDAKDTKSMRSTTPSQLKKKYEEKRRQILEMEDNEEDRNMALEELKDAYEIIENPDARKYYLLYGAKPPEQMRHISSRHGGWGQDVALGTFKHRMIIMWLELLHQYIGMWGETLVLGGAVLFMLSRLPMALKDAMRLLDELDPQGESEGETKIDPSETVE